jgi:hypothetical protein
MSLILSKYDFSEKNIKIISSFDTKEDFVSFSKCGNIFCIGFSNKVYFYKDGLIINRWRNHGYLAEDDLEFLVFENVKHLYTKKNIAYCVHKNGFEILEIYLDCGKFTRYNVISQEKEIMTNNDVGVVDITFDNRNMLIISFENLNIICEKRGDLYRIFGDFNEGCDVCSTIKNSSCNHPTSVEGYDRGIIFCDKGNKMLRYFDNSKVEILNIFNFTPVKFRFSIHGIFVLGEDGHLYLFNEDFKGEVIRENVIDFYVENFEFLFLMERK